MLLVVFTLLIYFICFIYFMFSRNTCVMRTDTRIILLFVNLKNITKIFLYFYIHLHSTSFQTQNVSKVTQKHYVRTITDFSWEKSCCCSWREGNFLFFLVKGKERTHLIASLLCFDSFVVFHSSAKLPAWREGGKRKGGEKRKTTN